MEEWIETMSSTPFYQAPQEVLLEPILTPEVNQGRWIILCPSCSGAEIASTLLLQFYCFSCFNSGHDNHILPIAFPDNKEEIEIALLQRPHHDFMSWTDETIEQLMETDGFHRSWATPRTWITNELVTSAIFNTHIKDNFDETAPAKSLAEDDLFLGAAANNELKRLAKGAVNTLLGVTNAGTVWRNIDRNLLPDGVLIHRGDWSATVTYNTSDVVNSF